MKSLSLPSTIELRCRDEIVDSVDVIETSPFEDIALEFIESATSDAHEEGKTRTYQLVGINENQERYICPFKIRRRIDKSTGDLVVSLTKQVGELHSLLMKKESAASDLLLKYAETVSAQYNTIIKEVTSNREKQAEFYDKLEQVRSKQLERDLMQEKHKSDLDMQDRLLSAAIPMAMAIGNKLTGGKMLPGKGDMRQAMLNEIVKGMGEDQIDSIANMLGPQWRQLFIDTLEDKPTLPMFYQLVSTMNREQLYSAVQMLNVGQQTAIQELLHANGNNGH